METDLCAVAPADWQIRSVEDVCVRVTSGGTPSRRVPSYYAAGRWPWVKTQELQDKWIDDTEEHITDEAVAASSAKVLPKNTVLLAMYGATVGQLGVLRRPMTCNQASSALVVDPARADYRYLFFQLLQARPQLKRLATGAAQQNLSGVLIRSLRFPYPSLPEQSAIANILGTLDEKIELNRRMNQALEAMARALFRSWFVDFDPVRAKVERRDPGMPSPIADLFPDRFKDPEPGSAPGSWSAGRLEDFAYLNPESWSTKTMPDAIKYVDLTNTKRGQIEAVAVYARREAPSRAQRVLRPGDTVVGTVRPGNGSFAFIAEDGLTGSTGFAVLRPRRNEYAAFVYLAATSVENVEALAHLADGAAYPAIRPEVVAATQAVRPNDEVLARFAQVADPLLRRFARNEHQSRALGAIRDALLPKLISGEIRVPQAENILKTAAL